MPEPDASGPAGPVTDLVPPPLSAGRASERSPKSAPPPGRSGSDGSETVGDLAIVLHSHMPYVEGFGTYPFGEEWLFDAVIRSYLPVLEVAKDVTMTITPVLADQLEDRGARARLRDFLTGVRLTGAEIDLREVSDELRPGAAAEAERYRHALK